MRSATHSSLENGLEPPMEAELKQKVVEGIKNQFGQMVSRIEGFLVIQIGNNGSPLNLHISYKDIMNGFSQKSESASINSSTSSLSSITPYKAVTNCTMPPSISAAYSRKVNRRKAYMPQKCEEAGSPPAPPPAHSNHVTMLPRPQASPEDMASNTPTSRNLTLDPDPMGPLNADAIQASMNQVMHSSLPVFPMNQFHTDIQLPMSIVNTVIPVPQVLGESSALHFGSQIPTPSQKVRLGKSPEQRKIKPKPVSFGAQGLGVTAPYHKPSGTTSKRNPNKEFACNQCTERFKSLNLLTEHTTLVHLCFRCTTCNSKFTQRSNLQRHSLKHLGFKPFKCSICLKEYYRKDHLVRHIEVSHPGSEPKSSILNVMPSADCLRILEESQADALRKKQAKEAELGRASAPQTPVASKSLDTPSGGPSPAASDTAVATLEKMQPTDLSIRPDDDLDDEDDDADPLIFGGMEIVNDLIGDDDLEEDMEDELEELEMDLDDGTLDSTVLNSPEVSKPAVNGESTMIRLPNPSARAVDST